MKKIVMVSFTILLLNGLAIQGVDGYQYIGCFRYFSVTNEYPLLAFYTLAVPLTVDSCVDKCKEEGATYGGLSDTEYMCTDEKVDMVIAPNEIYCDTKCAGNSSQTCGGYDGISLYSIPDAATTTTNEPTTTTNEPTTTTNEPTTTTNEPTTTTNEPTTTTNEPTTTTNEPTTTTNEPTTTTSEPTTTAKKPMTTTPTRYRPRPLSKYNDTPCEKSSKFYGICQYNDMDCPNGTYTDGLCRRPINKGQIPFNGAEIHVSCCIYNQHSGYPPMQ